MRNKYHAKRVGKFDSKAEAEYADVLELLKRSGKIKSYKHHPEPVVLMESIDPKGKNITWKIDFLVRNADGWEYYVEVKGFKTADYNLKLRMYRNLRRKLPLFVVQRYGSLRYKVIDTVNTEKIIIETTE